MIIEDLKTFTIFFYRISGSGVPSRVPKEDLGQIAIELCGKVGVLVNKDQLASVDRKRNGDIAVLFTSKIHGSPLHQLRGVEVRAKAKKLKDSQLFFNHLLTPTDGTLYWKVRRLVGEGKIKSSFISRRHLVHIYKLGESKPVAVVDETMLVNL